MMVAAMMMMPTLTAVMMMIAAAALLTPLSELQESFRQCKSLQGLLYYHTYCKDSSKRVSGFSGGGGTYRFITTNKRILRTYVPRSRSKEEVNQAGRQSQSSERSIEVDRYVIWRDNSKPGESSSGVLLDSLLSTTRYHTK
jgi:hypothetical protein